MRETSIGLKRGTVRLEPYNPVWTQMFERDRKAIEELFGDRILAIDIFS